MSCKIYGMIHLQALPGTPKNKYSVRELTDQALKEADLLVSQGIDGLIIENMHDVPYLNREVGPEIVSAMTLVSSELRASFRTTDMGVQVLAGANKEALAIAHSCQLDFIRSEGFVFSHIADEGLMNSDAAELLRYRRSIGAEKIKIYCDIKKKHSAHSITADLSIEETAKAAHFFLSDGLILTGRSTGVKASVEQLRILKDLHLDIPILVGSGINKDNVHDYLHHADILIVGSHFKTNGLWSNPLDKHRISNFMKIVK